MVIQSSQLQSHNLLLSALTLLGVAGTVDYQWWLG